MPLMRAAEPAAATSTAPAQHPRAAQMRERRMTRLDEQLALTPEQKAQIAAIWDKAEKESAALRHDAAVTAGDRKTKRRVAMKSARAEVRAVLTPEQQKKFDAMPRDGAGARHDSSGDARTN
jgi:Spy/CpxP family protein refolding chaperone